MAEAADTAPALQQLQRPASVATATTASDVISARLQQVLALLFPSNLAAKAALLALVVALLALLPSGQAPRIWELPHLLLLGIIISYGVFGQRNADAEVAVAAAAAAEAEAKPADEDAAVEAYVSQMMQGSLPLVLEDNDRDGDGGASKKDGGGVQAWSSQYLPDDPLVVVADAARTTDRGNGDAGVKPLLLPVRKLKPAAEESATLTLTGDMHMSDSGIEDEEEEEEELFIAPKAGYAGSHAVPSPSSVLDADLTLSPSSPPLLPPPPPPPPPPFLDRGRILRKAKARSFNEFGALGHRSTNGGLGLHGAGSSKQFRSKSAVQATRRTFAGYEPVVPIDDEADDEKLDLDEMVAAASDSSFSGDDVATDVDEDTIREENSCEEDERDEDDGGNSCDEELFELATRPGPEAEAEAETEEEEVEDEVDRKADEFIAKFREQIRMQKVEPARR